MARKKQETLVLFPEVMDITRKFSDEKFGILMRAVFSYRFSGEEYGGDDLAVEVAFRSVVSQIDRYAEYCNTQSMNRKGNGGTPSTTKCTESQPSTTPIQSISISNPIPGLDRNSHKQENLSEREKCCSVGADKPPATPRFSPPSVDDVQEFCEEKGLIVDADRFVCHYQSNGWMVGKNKMRDWRAAVRNWAKREQERPATGSRKSDHAPMPNYEEGREWSL